MCSLWVVCQTSNSGRIHVRILGTLSQIAPLSCSPERARNWRSNSAVPHANRVCSLWFVCQTSNSGGIHVRILETLSQIAPLSWSPERARNWRSNFATSYVNHVCSLWVVCQTSNSGGVHVRIFETLAQITPLSCSP